MFNTVEIEELSLGNVHVGGNNMNLQGMISGMAYDFCSLVDVQSSISVVLLKIGLSHCYICLRWHRAMWTS